jgi:hypothetical protein
MLADFSRGGRPRMLLAVPAKPLATKDQRKAASAKLNSTNPWKISALHRP